MQLVSFRLGREKIRGLYFLLMDVVLRVSARSDIPIEALLCHNSAPILANALKTRSWRSLGRIDPVHH